MMDPILTLVVVVAGAAAVAIALALPRTRRTSATRSTGRPQHEEHADALSPGQPLGAAWPGVIASDVGSDGGSMDCGTGDDGAAHGSCD